MSLKLIDRSIKYHYEILEDAPIGIIHITEIEEELQLPVILGRNFLMTAQAITKVKRSNLVFKVEDENIEFQPLKFLKNPSFEDFCCKIDVIYHCVKELS